MRLINFIGPFLMGIAISVCGIRWDDWRYWVLFPTALIWVCIEIFITHQDNK